MRPREPTLNHPPISILACLRQAMATMWRHPTDMLRAFWPAYLAAIPVNLLYGSPWQVAALLASALAAVPCACAWHCRVIAGDSPSLTLRLREWNFVKVQVSILVVTIAVLFASVMVGTFALVVHWSAVPVLGFVGIVVASWVVAPMLLGLPAAALGHKRSSAQLDAAAKPHRIKLTVLTMLIPMAQSLMNQLFQTMGNFAPVGSLTLDLICWPLGIGILSLAYVRLGLAEMSNDMETAQP